MKVKLHNAELEMDWSLINLISLIDRFDAKWTAVERREGQTLKELKSIATVRSIASSTRIEGSKLSNEEVDVLIQNMDISKLEDRDEQEVVGYFEVLDTISESHEGIRITENTIKSLHNLLMKFSNKDDWHKGNYKQVSNAVEASFADGTTQVIFNTTNPGFATDQAMQSLVQWYNEGHEVHPLVRTAFFAYEFLSIHPFQDGNGRMSRLLTTLLLLKNGYKWIEYVSFEHEIEDRKSDYYGELRRAQANRPGEDVTAWIKFFFECLLSIQELLMEKLRVQGVAASLSPREKSILSFITVRPGCKSGDIAKRLDIPSPTVKRLLRGFMDAGLIEKHGAGAGTNYTAN